MTQQMNETDEFIVPAYDLDGRYITLSLRVPPLLSQVLREIVESRSFPFRTEDDVVRWCVHHGINALESMGTASSILPVLEMSLVLVRSKIRKRQFDDFFTKLDRVMLQLAPHHYMRERARKLVRAIYELVLSMPSSFDRGLYLTELRQRWGYLVTELEDLRLDRNERGT
jgi:hypothetical protein